MPRPATENSSVPGMGSTRRATLRSISRSNRSRRWRLVTKRPSWPASGEVFTPKVIFSVGSSTTTRGSARGKSGSLTVSPISTFSSPTRATMSPASPSWHLDAPQVLEDVDGNDPRGGDAVLALHQDDVLARLDGAGVDAAHGDPPHVIGPVQGGHEHLQGGLGVDLGAGNLLEDQVHQRRHRAVVLGQVVGGITQLGAGEDVGEIRQVVLGPQLHEQIENLVDHFMGAGVGAIDLVDHDHRPQPALQGLGEHEAGLRHGAFGRIDQHQRPVGHPQHALDLAAEIGVAGGVDDVDLHAPVGNGDVLGQDGDAPLPLQVVGVEDLLPHQLRLAVAAALAQHAIDQRRLAVVDVGDDGHVANILAAYRHGGWRRGKTY